MAGLFAFLAVLVFAGLIVGLILTNIAKQSRTARERAAEDKARQIVHDFPDEVRAWGGRDVLRDPKKLQEIIAKLEADAPAR